MTACAQTLITHRFANSPLDRHSGRLYECPDPECRGRPEDHPHTLPCAWSWPAAHGRTDGGQPFPRRRCPSCAHIPRSGQPQDLAAPTSGRTPTAARPARTGTRGG
jgi:hypothetical protein